MLLAGACVLAACGQAKAPAESRAPAAPQAALAKFARQDVASAASGSPAARRYVAVRNFLAVEVDADKVQATLDAAVARCRAPDCEILESAITRDYRDAPPTARLRMRIAPAAVDSAIGELAKAGDIIERRTESEDKTDEVVDVDARLKNTTELRDRLRKLLATPNAPVKDLVEVESQLARVQQELDSAQGRRLALANETEKVAVSVDIRSRRVIGEAGVWTPVSSAVSAIGRTLAGSLGALITFVVAVLPWMLLVIPAAWWLRRWRRARKTASQR